MRINHDKPHDFRGPKIYKAISTSCVFCGISILNLLRFQYGGRSDLILILGLISATLLPGAQEIGRSAEDSDENGMWIKTVELRKVAKVVKCLAMLRARIFLTISLDFAKGWHFDRLQSGASILTQDQISGTAVPFWAPAGSGAIGAARLPMGQCL